MEEALEGKLWYFLWIMKSLR